MKRYGKSQAFRKRFPWLKRHVPDGTWDFSASSISSELLESTPGLGEPGGPYNIRNRFLLLDADGNLVTEVLCAWGMRIFGRVIWFPIANLQEETVSDALTRLGKRTDNVQYVLCIYRKWWADPRVVVCHPRNETSVASVWRRVGAKEEADASTALRTELKVA